MATEGRPIGNLVINATLDDVGVNKGITGLKNNLKTAQSATKAMVQELKSVGDELGANKKQLEGYSNQLKIQEKIVKEYNKAYQEQVKKYGEGTEQAQKYAQRLNSQIQTYQSLQGSIRRTENTIKRLELAQNDAGESSNKLSKTLKGAGDATKDTHDKTSGFSSFIKKGMVGALAAGVAGVAALSLAVGGLGAKMALDTQKTQGQVRAQLGLTEREAMKVTNSAKSLWADGFGENVGEAKNAIVNVKQNIKSLKDATDETVKEVTKGTMTISETFDQEGNEITKTINAMQSSFDGLSPKKSMDLITTGFQNGLDYSGEFLDSINEYSNQFKAAGFSAQSMFTVFKAGADSGAFQLDKVGDLVKEFNIRLSDGSAGEAISSLSKHTQELYANFKKTGKGGSEIFTSVMKDIDGMKDHTKAYTAGQAIMGTQFEDLGQKGVSALANVKNSFTNVDGATQKAGAALRDNFGDRLKKMGRTALVSLTPIGNGLLNVLEPAVKGLETGMKGLEPTFKKISDAGSNVKKVFSGIFDIFNGDTSKGADKLMDFFPVLTVQKIIDGINSIKTAFSSFKQQAQPIISNMKASFDAVKPTFSTLGTIASQVFGTLGPLVKQALGGVVSFIGQITGQWKNFWQQNGSVISQALQNVWKVVQFVMPAVLAIISSVWGNIKGVITGAISILQGVILVFSGLLTGNFSKMWEGIKKIFSGAIKVVWNAIQLSFFGKILGGAKALGAGLKGIFPKMWGWIKSLFKDGATNAGKMFGYLKDKAFKIVGDMKNGIVKKFWEIVDAAKSLPKKMGDGIKEMGGKAWSGIKDFGNRTLRGFGKIINGFTQQGINWILGKIGVDFKVPKWEVPQYAHGTGSHQGGLAILGDGRGANAGSEAYITPSGHVGLSPATDTLMNLPKGTQVLSALETKSFLSGIPAYANGTKKKEGFISKMWNGAKSAVGKVKDLALDVFDYMTNPSKLITKVIEKLGIKLPDVKGVTGEVLKGSFSVIKDKFVGFIKGKFGESSNFGKGGTEAVKKWVAQALKIKGLGNEFSSALETIAMMESGGNPNVVNRWDSNWKAGHPSQGLMQFIPSTFEAHKEKGYGNIKNPVHQILASINYLNSRYGGILNHPGLRSMAKGGKYVGYDKGGLITSDHMAEVHRGELILPLRRFRRTQAHKVLSQAANMVGYKPEAQQPADNNAFMKMISMLQQQIDNQQAQMNQQNQVIGLLTKLVTKDPQVNLNIQDLNKFQDKAYYAEKNQKALLNNVSFT
ncbi:phage tail tape measure protein [Bacillus sp. FSL K6-1234]|uniref:phage tail tape measure protein n=1 Tax=Bacillus sp. FSL K6-1234 TaxID=2976832 RepID=UPI0030FB28F9